MVKIKVPVIENFEFSPSYFKFEEKEKGVCFQKLLNVEPAAQQTIKVVEIYT